MRLPLEINIIAMAPGADMGLKHYQNDEGCGERAIPLIFSIKILNFRLYVVFDKKPSLERSTPELNFCVWILTPRYMYLLSI